MSKKNEWEESAINIMQNLPINYITGTKSHERLQYYLKSKGDSTYELY